jgi:hypothetical protein
MSDKGESSSKPSSVDTKSQPNEATEVGSLKPEVSTTEQLLAVVLAQQQSAAQDRELISQLTGKLESLNSRFDSLEKENRALRTASAEDPELDSREADAEVFLDCQEFFDEIEPGFTTFPPRSETVRPHLFELQQNSGQHRGPRCRIH